MPFGFASYTTRAGVAAADGGGLARRLARLRVALIGPLALLLIWWLAFDAQWVSHKLLPSPWATVQALWQSAADGTITKDFKGSLYRTPPFSCLIRRVRS